MNIVVYTLCYNEIYLAPFVVDYWKRFANKVVVYDNGSTDGTIEYLSQFPFIEVRNWDTNGRKSEQALIDLKNQCWKESIDPNIDLVIVSDFDEVLYVKDKNDLNNLKGCTLWNTNWYELVCDNNILPKYDPNKLFHQFDNVYYVNQNKHYIEDHLKMVMFNPNNVINTNYSIGAHSCNIEVKQENTVNNDDICIFHLNQLCPIYTNYKNKKNRERQLQSDVCKTYGYHYWFSDNTVLENYNNALAQKRKLNFD